MSRPTLDNLFLIAHPGSMATAIARRLPLAMPPLTAVEASDLTDRYHIQRKLFLPGEDRPFRAPHHSCSNRALRGEIRLASHGVLFLDCVTEFRPATLGVLRNDLRSAPIVVVSSSSPCPCGYRGSLGLGRPCCCSAEAVKVFESRVDGIQGLLGGRRIDLRIGR